MTWVSSPRSPMYLSLLSFSESIFFPIPVDVMLAPMVLAKPPKAFVYALNATCFSVVGAVVGYLIGLFSFEAIGQSIVDFFGYQDVLDKVQLWLGEWGFWVIFVVGFSPIPYKMFTLGAGMVGLAFLPFLFASFISRGLRYFLVAWLMVRGGERLERILHRYIDRLGWATVILLVIVMAIRSIWAKSGVLAMVIIAPLLLVACSGNQAFAPAVELNKGVSISSSTKIQSNTKKLLPKLKSNSWQWPTRGKVVRKFSPKDGHKGVDISGKFGQPVKAVADGKVVYSGHGLLGYGKLIILKHANGYLSAYAHNHSLLVSEGERVRRGSTIARMGRKERKVALHFELRYKGKPVDPLKYL